MLQITKTKTGIKIQQSAKARASMVDEIMAEAKAQEGRSRVRVLLRSDAEEFVALLATQIHNPAIADLYLRVYPWDAFVANSYKYPAETTCVQLIKGSIEVTRVGAKRSGGAGNLCVKRGKWVAS